MDQDLARFVDVQEGSIDAALRELRSGRKTSHWMWFVFPQLAGLGRSEMARRYAIASLDEARAYLEHPVLGARLRSATDAMLASRGMSAVEVLGSTDAKKLRSSMTLFGRADPGEPRFRAVLDRFYDGAEDPATLELLGIRA